MQTLVTANSDGSVMVKFSISDTGNNGLDNAKIVAIKNNSGPARLQSVDIIEGINVGNEIVTSPNVVGTSSYTFTAGTLEYFLLIFFFVRVGINKVGIITHRVLYQVYKHLDWFWELR